MWVSVKQRLTSFTILKLPFHRLEDLLRKSMKRVVFLYTTFSPQWTALCLEMLFLKDRSHFPTLIVASLLQVDILGMRCSGMKVKEFT